MQADVLERSETNADAFSKWDGRVPIVLGIAAQEGADIRGEPLTAALTAECVNLRKKYSASPFVILSSLAEGAERLLVHIAMKELAADLIAVLPMPKEGYERGFASEDSKSEFRECLDHALCVKIPASCPGESLDKQTARAAALIADHAQILFAVWDGKETGGTGGIGEQVAWFKQGYSPKEYSIYGDALTPLDPLEPGRLIRVHPVSAQVSTEESPPYAGGKPKKGQSYIGSILRKTEQYNRDCKQRDGNITSTPLPSAQLNGLAITNLVYQAADGLSARFANIVRSTDAVVYFIALFAVAIFNFVSSKLWAPWAYLGVTCAMLLLGFRLWRLHMDNRFLEYRCLAEAMRTLFFWRTAGVTRPVWLPFLARQSGVVHWIRQAVRTVEFCQDCRLPGGYGGTSGVAIAKTLWVDDQRDWLKRRQRYHYRRFNIWRWVSRVALGLSFATAIALAVLTVLHDGSGQKLWDVWVEPTDYADWWQVALGVFAAGAVAAKGFLLRNAHLELAKQYASQGIIFENASLMLERINSVTKPGWTAPEILEKLGQEALQEQAEWVWLRHTRPFEVPA